MKRWPVESQILAGLTLALVLLAAMGYLVYDASRDLLQTHRGALRSQHALTTLEALSSLVRQTEAEQRLYFITGNPEDLNARQTSASRIDHVLAELQEFAAEDTLLMPLLPDLERTVRERVHLLDWSLEGYRRGGAAEVRRRVIQKPGREEMALLRGQLDRMEVAILGRLEERNRRARGDATLSAVFVALLLILSGTAVSALYLRIRREMRERQQAQEALTRHVEDLRNSETRLRAVVDTAIDAIIVINERGIVDRFNRAAERIFGYAAEEVIGRNISMLMPSPDQERHDGYLERYLAGGEPRIIGIGREVTARRKDGTTFPIDLAVSEMRVGERRMFTGIVRDITERKRAEEQRLRLIGELQHANEELTNFAYVVSHDLKAPLRAIGSLADWLNTDYQDKLDREGQEHLRLLKSRVRRMDGLIDGILEYSRIGRVKDNLAPVDTSAAVRDALYLLAPPPHIRVVVEGHLPTVTGDPVRIQQIFQNLLSNAIKYMDKPEGLVRISCRAENDMWQFSVTDNGPGIDPRHHERIFHLFQTLAPRDRVESTGVGLTLVKKVVELYGGRVWLESTPREGTTFHFTLPRNTANQASMETSAL